MKKTIKILTLFTFITVSTSANALCGQFTMPDPGIVWENSDFGISQGKERNINFRNNFWS